MSRKVSQDPKIGEKAKNKKHEKEVGRIYP
jgi:hypothetical protein